MNMSSITEMKAYEGQINLDLFNEIVAFVLQSAAATYSQKKDLSSHCVFMAPDVEPVSLQQKYEFLYLGELLERYEERFGMEAADLRAITLALGYTRQFLRPEMFIGSQREVFIQKAEGKKDGDVYLTGALYLLCEDEEKAESMEAQLRGAQYEHTEELIFVLSLFPDDEQTLRQFMPAMLRLLGHGRTIPVLGNTRILGWLVVWMQLAIKSVRGKDAALCRTLCLLPTTFVKEGSKHHGLLGSYGYSPLEIAYANMQLLCQQRAIGVLRPRSLVAEKIVIALFKQVMGYPKGLEPEVYEQLTRLFQSYTKFEIKLEGNQGLLEALHDGPQIENAETFSWLQQLAPISHPVFGGYDICDKKWDSLSQSMPQDAYLKLFEGTLNNGMEKSCILTRIERYNQLTGRDYLKVYTETEKGMCFKLLVEKDIIDLWTEFRSSLDAEGNVQGTQMMRRIKGYLHELRSIQAFRFYERLFSKYGVGGLERFFSFETYDRLYLPSSLVTCSYWNDQHHLTIDLKRSFLSEEEHRNLLSYLNEFYFACEPQKYIPFIVAVLKNEFASQLLSEVERRALFEEVLQWQHIGSADVNALKARYFTQEEKAAEEAAKLSAKEEERRLERQKAEQALRERFERKCCDDKFAPLNSFLDRYFYEHEKDLAMTLVKEKLSAILRKGNYALDRMEAVQFFHVCARLLKEEKMSLAEIRQETAKLKEVEEA